MKTATKSPESADYRRGPGIFLTSVPMFAVHGDQDKLVPYDLNTKILKERYEAGGGSIQVKVIPGKGHQDDPAFLPWLFLQGSCRSIPPITQLFDSIGFVRICDCVIGYNARV